MTPLDTAPDNTMYVLDRNGKDLAAPRMGTMARWGADSGTVIYRDFAGNKRAWHLLDLGTGKVRDLAMTAGTVRPALSPDRTLIAYDDAQGEPTIYVFDLTTGRERKLATGSLGAIWLSNDTLAATVVRACVPATNCEGNWVDEKRAVHISLADGAGRPITLRSTLEAAAFLK